MDESTVQPVEAGKVGEAFEALALEPGKILVCLSGGPDSVCLLWAAVELGYETAAFHLDHALRDDSHRDAEVAAEAAERIGVELITRKHRPEFAEGSSPETAARELRYRIANEVADELGAAWIATAHTANDQIETLFINLLRGAALDGLAGIPPRRGRIVRPMLGVWRAESRARCEAEKLPFVDDPSNLDTAFLRNRIRHQLMPNLEEALGPGLWPSMLRQVKYLRDDAEFLRGLAERKLGRIARVLAGGRAIALRRQAISGMEPALARRIVRTALMQLREGPPPTGARIDDALRVPERGGAADLGGGWIARAEGEFVVLRPAAPIEIAPYQGELPGRIEAGQFGLTIEAELSPRPPAWPLSDTEVWMDPSAAGRVTIRTPASGERFRPVALGGSKTLTDFLADRGMIRTERETAPILAKDGVPLWVVGHHRLSEEAAVHPDNETALHIRVRRHDG